MELRAVRRIFLTGTSLLALFGYAAAASAQSRESSGTADQADQADELSDIVVTGIRASLTSSRNIKKNAEQVMESITAEDIGALPDRSVSEALQRIPGITLQRTNEARDPARMAAEGGGVFVRGLSWVRSELNGRDIFSANSGRALSFEDVSADLMAGVDVFKNPSADMVEGGIGGIVNLRTRKPFDAPGQVIAMSGDYNYADMRKKGFWSGNALYSNRWGLGAGEIGLLLSASISNIGNRTDSIQTGSIRETAENSGRYAPSSLGWRRIDWEQKRTAYSGVLQLKPSDELVFTFEAIYSKATPKDVERAMGTYSLPATGDDYVFDENGILQSGTNRNANLDLNTRYGRSRKITRDLSWNLRFTPNDRWAFNADVQRVTSKANVLSFTVFTQFGVERGISHPSRPDLIFDLSGNSPSMSLKENGASLADKSNYWWAAAMDHIERNTAGSWAERADVEYTFDDDSFLKSFRVGVRATSKTAVTRQTGYNWSLLSNQYWLAENNDVIHLDELGSPPNSALPEQSELFEFNKFFRGDIAVPGVGWFPTASLVSNGTDRAYEFLKSTETASWGWAPLTEDSYETARPGTDNPSGGITTQKERTRAIYGLLRFGMEEGPLGRFDGNIGVRIVQTRNNADYKVVVTGPQGDYNSCLTANPGNPAACVPLLNAITFAGGQGATNTIDSGVAKSRYTDVMPTLNLRFFLQDDLQLRLAAGRAIVRPNFTQMIPYTSLSFDFEDDGYTPGNNPLTGTSGNPGLKPIQSTQFDASLEYYWGSGNSLTFAAFYKDIKDFIYSGTVPVTYTNNGVTQTFELTQFVNGSKGKIQGFEAAYQQFFDFLPGVLAGLGFQGNFTFVDSSGGANMAVNVFDPNQNTNAAKKNLPLEGMSKYAFNLALLYEKYGVSARLAYNWRSRYLLTTSAANLNQPVWAARYGQLDGSILYQVNSHLKVGVQGTNLLRARVLLDVGDVDVSTRYSWTDSDRRIAFIARASF